jgi:hypothetical protein
VWTALALPGSCRIQADLWIAGAAVLLVAPHPLGIALLAADGGVRGGGAARRHEDAVRRPLPGGAANRLGRPTELEDPAPPRFAHWEASEDRAKTWRKDFDLTYERTRATIPSKPGVSQIN